MGKKKHKPRDDEEEPKGKGETSSRVKKKPYEKELKALSVELVKLQEWVKQTGHRIVVIFEGRDAAGKGGAIKSISQSMSARVCRVVALTAPSDREKTQWYFQRYAPHLPVRGRDRALRPQLVQPGRSGAGHGVLHGRRVPGVPPLLPGVRADAGALGHPGREVLVLGQRRGAGEALPGAPGRSDQTLEAEPHGPRVALTLGGVLAGQGRDVLPHRHQAGALVRRGGRRQARAAAEPARAPALPRPLRGHRTGEDRASQAAEGRRPTSVRP